MSETFPLGQVPVHAAASANAEFTIGAHRRLFEIARELTFVTRSSIASPSHPGLIVVNGWLLRVHR